MILSSKYMSRITTLDLSNGTLSDKGGELLLKTLPKYPNVTTVDLHFHYLSDEMMEKLKALPISINLEEANKEEVYNGEVYRYAMLTE